MNTETLPTDGAPAVSPEVEGAGPGDISFRLTQDPAGAFSPRCLLAVLLPDKEALYAQARGLLSPRQARAAEEQARAEQDTLGAHAACLRFARLESEEARYRAEVAEVEAKAQEALRAAREAILDGAPPDKHERDFEKHQTRVVILRNRLGVLQEQLPAARAESNEACAEAQASCQKRLRDEAAQVLAQTQGPLMQALTEVRERLPAWMAAASLCRELR